MTITLTTPHPHLAHRWAIEASHLAAVPEYIDAANLTELESHVQLMADGKKLRSDRPPIGPVSFRYETDKRHRVTVVHAYFVNKHGVKTRFMRLRYDGMPNA